MDSIINIAELNPVKRIRDFFLSFHVGNTEALESLDDARSRITGDARSGRARKLTTTGPPVA